MGRPRGTTSRVAPLVQEVLANTLLTRSRDPILRQAVITDVQVNADRSVAKIYLALVVGALEPAEGVIEAPIGRDPRNRKRMAVVSDGKPARTSYVVREQLGEHSFVEA